MGVQDKYKREQIQIGPAKIQTGSITTVDSHEDLLYITNDTQTTEAFKEDREYCGVVHDCIYQRFSCVELQAGKLCQLAGHV